MLLRREKGVRVYMVDTEGRCHQVLDPGAVVSLEDIEEIRRRRSITGADSSTFYYTLAYSGSVTRQWDPSRFTGLFSAGSSPSSSDSEDQSSYFRDCGLFAGSTRREQIARTRRERFARAGISLASMQRGFVAWEQRTMLDDFCDQEEWGRF